MRAAGRGTTAASVCLLRASSQTSPRPPQGLRSRSQVTQVLASGCFNNAKEVLGFIEQRRGEEANASFEVCFHSVCGSGPFAL